MNNVKKTKLSLLDSLKKYFDETPRHQIEKDWESTKQYDNVGPSISTFEKTDSQRIQDVELIISIYRVKLDNLKHSLSKWEEENWTDAEINECRNMIKILSSILSDLKRAIK